VPARNTVMLSLALAWAEVLGARDIFVGVNAVDYSGYPDCRPEFIAAFEAMANLATKAAVEGARLRIHAPLIALSKADIIRRGTAPSASTTASPFPATRPTTTARLRPVRFLPPARAGFEAAGSPIRPATADLNAAAMDHAPFSCLSFVWLGFAIGACSAPQPAHALLHHGRSRRHHQYGDWTPDAHVGCWPSRRHPRQCSAACERPHRSEQVDLHRRPPALAVAPRRRARLFGHRHDLASGCGARP
jgi:hypothetical protein